MYSSEEKVTRRSRQYAIFLVLLLLATSIAIQSCSSTSGEIKVGDQAPEFSLPASDGSTVTLSDFTAEQPVLLYFHMAEG